MERLAQKFDAPVDSREHVLFAETAWMGGELVSVRYYLGRLTKKNLFRVTDEEVEEQLVKFISTITSQEGGELVRGISGWQIAAEFLRHRFETQIVGKQSYLARRLSQKQVEAIEAFLSDPSLSMAQLATVVGTTEKQLGRNSMLSAAMRQRNERQDICGKK